VDNCPKSKIPSKNKNNVIILTQIGC